MVLLCEKSSLFFPFSTFWQGIVIPGFLYLSRVHVDVHLEASSIFPFHEPVFPRAENKHIISLIPQLDGSVIHFAT